MLSHRHAARECSVAFAAWRGFDSPLRRSPALASCVASPDDEHVLIWTVDAESSDEALALLPPWLAERSDARRVGEVAIP